MGTTGRKPKAKWRKVYDITNEFIDHEWKYSLINKDTLETVGIYNSYTYASSRARYFYKRDMRKIEKILLS